MCPQVEKIFEWKSIGSSELESLYDVFKGEMLQIEINEANMRRMR